MKTKIRITVQFVLVIAAMLLGGCTGSTYDSSDRKRLEEAGRERLEEYFSVHLPEAEVVSVKAVEANREVTLKTLTNYVCGEYKEKGVHYDYYFDVKNERMFTSKKYTDFTSQVKEKVIDDLELKDQAKILSSNVEVYLPDMQEAEALDHGAGSEQWQMPPAEGVFSFSAPVIPLEAAEDPKAYVYAKDRKEIICVNLTLAVDVAENIDLSGYTVDDFYYGPLDDHMYYGYLCIHNALSVTYDRIGYGAEPTVVSQETLTAVGHGIDRNSYGICYEQWGDVASGESEIHGVIYRQTDQLDIDTGRIDTKIEHFDLMGKSE